MSEQKPKSIGERLIFAREHRDMSAADLRRALADRGLRVSRSRLWNYENRSDSMPKPEILASISAITGFNAGWILTGTGSVGAENPLTALLGSDEKSDHTLTERVVAEHSLARLLSGWQCLDAKQREAILTVIDLLIDRPGNRLS